MNTKFEEISTADGKALVNELSINFVWIPKEKISSGKIPIPNTSEAPFIENIKRWKALNPEANVNLYIQQSMIKQNGVEETFFDNQSLTNLTSLLGSTINIEIMDRHFYEESC
ncbi:MAG: hypothetical protein Q8R24_04620 [Legionellaceae bacterium]|nr:hypothetical protein [Legionellaceae bacterium]